MDFFDKLPERQKLHIVPTEINLRQPLLDFNKRYPDFNWTQYRDNYPDLQISTMKTSDDFKKHWILHGHKEGRTYLKSTSEYTVTSVFHEIDSCVYKSLFEIVYIIVPIEQPIKHEIIPIKHQLYLKLNQSKTELKNHKQQLLILDEHLYTILETLYKHTLYGYVYFVFNQTIENSNLNLINYDYKYEPLTHNFLISRRAMEYLLATKINIKINQPDQIRSSLLPIFNQYQIYENISHHRANVYICLTTTPNRCQHPAFYEVIKSLIEQTLTPTKILISISFKYTKFPEINLEQFQMNLTKLKQMSNLIDIIECDDVGPLTKIIGMLNHHQQHNFLKPEDIMIAVDDDQIYHQNLTLWHYNCYQTYDLDGIGVNELNIQQYEPELMFNSKNSLYDAYYEHYLHGWLSYSFHFSALTQFTTYINNLKTSIPNICDYESIVMTAYEKSQCLRLGGINVPTVLKSVSQLKNLNHIITIPTTIPTTTTTNATDSECKKRTETDINRFLGLNLNSFKTGFGDQHQIITNTIPSSIPANQILITSNIHFKYSSAFEAQFVFVPRYYDNHHVELIITRLDTTNDSGWSFDLNLEVTITHPDGDSSKDYNFDYFVGPSPISKIVRIIHSHRQLTYQNHRVTLIPKKIMQTYEVNMVSFQKYLTFRSIIEMNPEYDYEFYNARERKTFLIRHFHQQLVTTYSLLKPKTYRADIFKYAYLYLYGGLTIDCKIVAHRNLTTCIEPTMQALYTRNQNKDLTPTHLLGLISKHPDMLKMLKTIISKVKTQTYGIDCQDITGARTLHQLVSHRPILTLISPSKSNLKNHQSYIKDNRTQYPILSVGYQNYYNENDYLKTTHYSLLWKQHQVYDHMSRNSQKILNQSIENLILEPQSMSNST